MLGTVVVGDVSSRDVYCCMKFCWGCSPYMKTSTRIETHRDKRERQTRGILRITSNIHPRPLRDGAGAEGLNVERCWRLRERETESIPFLRPDLRRRRESGHGLSSLYRRPKPDIPACAWSVEEAKESGTRGPTGRAPARDFLFGRSARARHGVPPGLVRRDVLSDCCSCTAC